VFQESQEAKDPPAQPDLMAHQVHLERTEESADRDKLEELDFPEREDQWESAVKMVLTEQWEPTETPALQE